MRQNTTHGRTPDALAPGSTGAAPEALAGATPTTRRLAEHSLSATTRADYLATLFDAGRAPVTAALVVAAVTFRATLPGDTVRGPRTDRVLAGFRRDGAEDGANRGLFREVAGLRWLHAGPSH